MGRGEMPLGVEKQMKKKFFKVFFSSYVKSKVKL